MSGAIKERRISPIAKPEHLNSLLSHQTSLFHLPDELILKIIDLCGPATSACLGLTSKRFYPIYRSKYASVSIGACVMVESEPRFLYQLLSEWMGSDYVLVFHPKLMRVFVKRELAAGQLEKGDLVECTLANWNPPPIGSSSRQPRS